MAGEKTQEVEGSSKQKDDKDTEKATPVKGKDATMRARDEKGLSKAKVEKEKVQLKSQEKPKRGETLEKVLRKNFYCLPCFRV